MEQKDDIPNEQTVQEDARNKEEVVNSPSSGTDLRKISVAELVEKMKEQGFAENEIKNMSRWEMVRCLREIFEKQEGEMKQSNN